MAYVDGEEVAVSKARTLEAEKSKSQMFYEVRIAPTAGEIDSTSMEGIIQQADGKDIAKAETESGVILYIVGPFSDKAKAEALADFVKAMGIGEVRCDLAGIEKELEI